MKLLKFGAIWCTECLVMKPMWEEIESEVPELKSEYFDADENEKVLKKYEIENIPAFIFLDNDGNEFKRFRGVQNKEEMLEFVKANLDK